MRKVEMYVTADNKVFKTAEEAIRHELECVVALSFATFVTKHMVTQSSRDRELTIEEMWDHREELLKIMVPLLDLGPRPEKEETHDQYRCDCPCKTYVMQGLPCSECGTTSVKVDTPDTDRLPADFFHAP
jgi:hypothetical protein